MQTASALKTRRRPRPRQFADPGRRATPRPWFRSSTTPTGCFRFRITRPQSLRFRSGEFVMIGLPNADKPVFRAYSIASPSLGRRDRILLDQGGRTAR